MMDRKSTDLKLTPILDLNAALGLRDNLAETIEGGSDIKIDFSRVERITTPCIQVIVAAKQAVEGGGRNFSVTGLAPSIRESFRDLGLGTVTAQEGGTEKGGGGQ